MTQTNDKSSGLVDYSLSAEFGIEAQSAATIKGMPEGTPGAPKRKEYLFQREVFRDLMAFWLSDEKALKIKGDPATGKTSLIEQFHARLRWPLMIVSCNQGMEPYQLYGQLLPNEAGQLRWVDGPVIKAARHGASVLLDEYNTLDPNCATGLNALLEGYSITIPETGELIEPHERFKVFATENPTTSQLVVTGRNVQDVANVDRWMIMEVDYMPPDQEVKLIKRHVEETNRDVTQSEMVARVLVQTASEVRKAFREASQIIDKPMSTRVLIRWARLLRMYRAVGGRPMPGVISPLAMSTALSRSFDCSSMEMRDEVQTLLRRQLGVDAVA